MPSHSLPSYSLSIVTLHSGNTSTISPCSAEFSTVTESTKNSEREVMHSISLKPVHNVSIDQALVWTPTKSVRVSLTGKLRLAPHAPSPGWHALPTVIVIIMIIIIVIMIIIVIVWQA